MFKLISFLILIFILMPTNAYAHFGAEGGKTFFSGLYHPVLGLDHFLAMVAVGIVSAQMGGRAIWTVPSTFVLVMAIGGLIGFYSNDIFGFENAIFFVEQGIILSVIIMGLAIAAQPKLHEFIAMAMVAFFALFHGYAHGHEFPGISIEWTYIAGFMTGTAGLHIAGVGIGLGSERLKHGEDLLRHCGSVMAGMGIYMQIDYIEYSYFWN